MAASTATGKPNPLKYTPGKRPHQCRQSPRPSGEHFKIAFQAPRFDAQGKKIANARFLSVDLNGVRIHENVEVPLPTGGPIENNEVLSGPLMIQGDHGPVAFRNIRYRKLQERAVQLTNIKYSLYAGDFKDISEIHTAKPTVSSEIPELSVDLPGTEDRFAIRYQGNLVVPEAGSYAFRLNYNGYLTMSVNGEKVLGTGNYAYWQAAEPVSVRLKAGPNPFELIYWKAETQNPPRLGFFSTDAYPKALHSFSSYPPEPSQVSPIYVEVGKRPRLLRAFLDFKGDYSQRLTHTIGVGSPQGVNFVYDLKHANPVCVWRGEFVDATPMWNGRGDGSFRPRGATQYLFTGAALAQLDTLAQAFPRTLSEAEGFKNKGYQIEEATGLPIFLYAQDTLMIEDRIYPHESGNALTRTLTVKNGLADAKLYLKLAEGDSIAQMPDGSYAVDQQYYLRNFSAQPPIIRQIAGKKELVVLLNQIPLHIPLSGKIYIP
ncbi:MAG: hypothetical protein HC880_07790 [Bacteroidia bacterium]|nr:hypothetical protein [Bacteroidia bacterium]